MQLLKVCSAILFLLASFILFLLALMRMFPLLIAAPLLYVSIVALLTSFTAGKRRFKGFR